MRPRDMHAESAVERVGGDPSLMRAIRMPAARNHGGLNALAMVAGNAVDVETRVRDTE